MPDAALQTTERQFAGLLRAARPDIDIRLRLFSFRNVARGARAAEHMRGVYDFADALPRAGLDGLIVTGAEPRAAELADEPYWHEFARLTDWVGRAGLPTLWSCLAAHAAVLRQAGVRRRRLPAKRSGVFICQTVSADPLVAGAAGRRFTPHSRYNELAESDLAEAGYVTLTRSDVAGVDSFVRRDRSVELFFQGHPEYEPDTLKREYLRDVARFLNGERANHPAPPSGYFDAATERALAALAERSVVAPTPELAEDYAAQLRGFVPAPLWRAGALQTLGAWLGEALAGASGHSDSPLSGRGRARTSGLVAVG
jgi:homoserine O-succinyltransferase